MELEKIVMPKLGESVTEGTVNSWLVSVGDNIQKYDPIAEVMTDKVNAEVPSSHTGTIREIVVEEGDTVEVGELICYIEVDVGGIKENRVSEETSPQESPVPATNSYNLNPGLSNTKHEAKPMKNRYSPAVLKLAMEHDINLSDINGSGTGGRITRKDIQACIKNNQDHTTQHTAASAAPQVQSSVSSVEDQEFTLTGVRKAIADNMIRSKKEIPHAWMTVEVDVTDLVHYRNQMKNAFKEREGISLTYFPFFISAVAQTLKAFPQINCVWNKEKLIQKQDINISIAVANENELFVPVIKNVDNLSIQGIAKEIDRLATKARNGTLSQADIGNGTFTVNNTGTFGSISSMGIINYPQIAILQIESIVRRPVIIQDMFAARDIVNLSLSLDHRVLDGLICGRFLHHLKEKLEGMNEQTLSI